MLKFLILTVTAGNGHNSCAYAMENFIKSNSNFKVKVVDTLSKYSNKQSYWITNTGYNIAVSKFLRLYNLAYSFFKKRKQKNLYKNYAVKIALSCTPSLLKEIYTYKPDIIYCTHFIPAIALSILRLQYNIPCVIYATSLDYTLTPFWECCTNINYLNIPSDDFKKETINLGFKENQILSFGIPIDNKFCKSYNKLKSKKDLNIPLNSKTILIMSGGGNFLNQSKILKFLLNNLKEKNYSLIILNGKNLKSYNYVNKLEQSSNLKILNIPFTTDVELYMSASDIAISKSGGVSISEMISMNLPFISNKKLPMQEKENLEYLCNKNLAFSYTTKKELVSIVNNILTNKDFFDLFAKNNIKNQSIDNLYNHLKDQPKAKYNNINLTTINYQNVKKILQKQLKNHKKTKKILT